ncbi:MAG: glycosyltransferase family 9 protein [Elusimicrobia bacterium]|nr:glycosyltransferase family 9 protein [Elusimicrobiota bacterium]
MWHKRQVQRPKSEGRSRGIDNPDAPRKILVIQLMRLGDVLLSTPAAALLRRRFPLARIDFLVGAPFADALRFNPNINTVLILPRGLWSRFRFFLKLRRNQYDWIIDFMANGTSAWAIGLSGAKERIVFESGFPSFVHNRSFPRPKERRYSALVKMDLVEQAAALLAGSPASQEDFEKNLPPKVFVQDDRLSAWKAVVESCGYQSAPLVFVSPASRQSSRRWKKEYFVELSSMLVRERGAHVVILWGPGERELAREIALLASHERVRLAPRLRRISDLAAFLGQGQLLITNCNGAKHVAVAMNVPTLTIHTSSDPIAWNPPPADSTNSQFPVIRKDDLWCIGCQKNICPYHMECAVGVPPRAVFNLAVRLLGVRKSYAANLA